MDKTEIKTELKGLIEALIFAADHPVTLDKLAGVLEGEEREAIKGALEELARDYSDEARGLILAEVAGGYQLRTRAEYAPWLRRLFKIGMQRISRAAMETLAIVAYKQPVTRAELEEVRGVDSAGVLRTLLDRRLVKITGRKDAPGRPVVYGTTKEFLETFDLKALSSLPTLKDIELLEEEEDGLIEEVGPEGGVPEEGSLFDQGLSEVEGGGEEAGTAGEEPGTEDGPEEAGTAGEEPGTEDGPEEADAANEESAGEDGPDDDREASEGDGEGRDSVEAEGRTDDPRGEGQGKREDDDGPRDKG